MASNEDQSCSTNAEDISPNRRNENCNLNSKPDSDTCAGDVGDLKENKIKQTEQKVQEEESASERNGDTESNTRKNVTDAEEYEQQINGEIAGVENENVPPNYTPYGQAKETSDAMNGYPSPVSEINAKEYRQLKKKYECKSADEPATMSPGRGEYAYNPYNPCSDSPGEVSGESDSFNRRHRRNSSGSTCDEKVRSIESEYIQRISQLEERHFELEDVLARLTSSLEPLFENEFKPDDVADAYAACIDDDPDYPEDRAEEKAKIDELLLRTEQQKKKFARMIGLELFLEFQQKIRNFAMELNGVLNCSEAAIRHARVVQEWGTSVQLMFEEMKEERMRMQDFIDERERSMMILRNQFASELQHQGNILRDLVEDMKSYRDLYDAAEKYGGAVAPRVSQCQLAKNIVDLLLKQRLDGEKALILDLKKQSKISEQKLVIIHQQSFIQQIQEQNRELRAIIEGLMGADDMYYDTPSGTPGSASSPERGSQRKSSTPAGTPGSVSSPERGSFGSFCSPDRSSLRQSLDQLLDKSLDTPVCKISDVLDCDRGEIYPGISTDGDIATIQTFGIGKGGKTIITDPAKERIYDPLSVPYIREQCRAVEEVERRQMMEQQEENKENIINSDVGVPTFQDGVEPVDIESYLRKSAVRESKIDGPDSVTETKVYISRDKDAGGDGSGREAGGDIGIAVTKVSPRTRGIDILAEYNGDDGDDADDDNDSEDEIDVGDILVDRIVDDISVAEPPIIDIENTNNNDN